MVEYDDALEEIEDISESLEDGIWLDTGEGTVKLPKEIAKYLEMYGIMGLA